MIEKVISGGQTGIDRLGLEVAKSLGIKTGGTAPKGYKTENGKDLSLKDFGLIEDESSDYNSRTLKNIIDSDGTVVFGNTRSPGTALTVKLCMMQGKVFISNPSLEVLIEFYKQNNIKVLNVAGNRRSKLNDKEIKYYEDLLRKSLVEYNKI